MVQKTLYWDGRSEWVGYRMVVIKGLVGMEPLKRVVMEDNSSDRSEEVNGFRMS